MSALAWIEEVHGSMLKIPRTQGTTSRLVAREATIRLRVVPDGKPEFRSEAVVQGKDVMQFGSDVDPWATDSARGEPTYVRYDPERPERCEIDHARIVAEYGEREHGHRMLIPQWSVEGKREIKPPLSAAASSAPMPDPEPQDDVAAGLARLAELHTTGALTDAEFTAAKARLIDPA
jgi:hypothetical protein